MNLTQRREGAKGAKMRFLRRYSRFYPVIPAKAGIQRIATKLVTRNQVGIASDKSPLPLWERARVRVTPRASAALRAGRPRSQGRKPTPASPLWERARVRRASAGGTPALPSDAKPAYGFPLSRESIGRERESTNWRTAQPLETKRRSRPSANN